MSQKKDRARRQAERRAAGTASAVGAETPEDHRQDPQGSKTSMGGKSGIQKLLAVILGIGAFAAPFLLNRGGEKSTTDEGVVHAAESGDYKVQDRPNLDGLEDPTKLTIEKIVEKYFANGNRVLGVGDYYHDDSTCILYLREKILGPFVKAAGDKEKILFMEFPISHSHVIEVFNRTGNLSPIKDYLEKTLAGAVLLEKFPERREELVGGYLSVFTYAHDHDIRIVAVDRSNFTAQERGRLGNIHARLRELEDAAKTDLNLTEKTSLEKEQQVLASKRAQDNPLISREVAANLPDGAVGLLFLGSAHFLSFEDVGKGLQTSSRPNVDEMLGISSVALVIRPKMLGEEVTFSSSIGDNTLLVVNFPDRNFRESVAITVEEIAKIGANPNVNNLGILVATAIGHFKNNVEVEVSLGNQGAAEYFKRVIELGDEILEMTKQRNVDLPAIRENLKIFHYNITKDVTGEQLEKLGYLQMAIAATRGAIRTVNALEQTPSSAVGQVTDESPLSVPERDQRQKQ